MLTGMYHRTECSGSFENDLKRQRVVFGNDASIGEHIEESINALSDIFQTYKTKMSNQAQIDSDKLAASVRDADTKFSEAKRASVEHARVLKERIMTLEGSLRDSESERNRDKLASAKAKVSADLQIQAVQTHVDAAKKEIEKYVTTIDNERSSLRTEFAREYTAAIKAYQLGADERCHSAASTAIRAADEKCRAVASNAIRAAKNKVDTMIAGSNFDSEKVRTELQIARQSIASLNFTIAQKNEEIDKLKVSLTRVCGR